MNTRDTSPQSHDPTSEAISPPPGLDGVPAVTAMLGLCFVVMLTAFDQTMIGIVLPRIAADLNGFDYYAWVGTAYLLCTAIAVPITGRLGDMMGRKPFLLAAIVLFCLASTACSMASSMLQLVCFRAIQGVGAGMLLGSTFASVADIFPDQMRRIRWHAMLSAAFGIANAMGPTLGGYITEVVGWRAVFLISLPIGSMALLMVGRFLPRVPGFREPGVGVDWTGALLLGATIALALFALQTAAADGVTSLVAWGLLLAAFGAGVLLVRSQRRARQPILPLHLFRIRAVRLLALIGLCVGWSMFVLVFYAPLLLQAGFGISPKVTGLLIAPLVVGITIGSLVNGRLFSRISRPHLLLPGGIFLFMFAYLTIILLEPDVSHVWIFTAFGVGGFALGFQFPNLTIQMQSCVERRDIGVASALVQTVRVLGSMIGAAVAGVIVTTLYSHEVAKGVVGVSGSAAVARLFADPQVLVTPDTHRATQQVLDPATFDVLLTTSREALINAVHGGLMVSLFVCLIAFLLAIRLPPITPRVH